jgi:competence protein ComEA
MPESSRTTTDRAPDFPPRPSEWGGPLDRFVDRVRELRGDPRVGVAALLVVALVVGFVWYRLGAGDSGASSTRSRPPASAATTATGSTGGDAKKGGRVTVHVAGAVAKPGVYDLDANARVIDAVEAAGGGAADADLNRLNLAAKVADGQRVHVQRVGEAAAPAPAAPGGAGGGSADPSALVNINSATPAELETLPGIGPTLAEAIIAERERRGGFRSVNELRDVRGIGEKRFADLKDKVTI